MKNLTMYVSFVAVLIFQITVWGSGFNFFSTDINENSCVVEYCVNTDKYYLNRDYIEPYVLGWQNAAYDYDNIEWIDDNPDSNTHWLKSKNGTSSIVWRFDFTQTQRLIENATLKITNCNAGNYKVIFSVSSDGIEYNVVDISSEQTDISGFVKDQTAYYIKCEFGGDAQLFRRTGIAGEFESDFTVKTTLAGSPIDIPAVLGETLYVCPNGSDLNPGTLVKPIKTIAKGKQKVREMLANGTKNNITIFVRNGKYYQDSTLVFTEKDSGDNGQLITYKNYHGEKPEIVGGKLLTGWELVDERENFYRTQISGDMDFSVIFENGKRGYLAREPDKGWLYIESQPNDEKPYLHLSYSKSDLPHTFDTSDVQVTCWPGQSHWNWMAAILPVENVDFASRDITLRDGGKMMGEYWGFGSGGRYRIQGAKEFLTARGEFWVDKKNGYIYYKPYNNDINSQEIVVPTVEKLIAFEGSSMTALARNIHFDGFTIRCSDSIKYFSVPLEGINNGTDAPDKYMWGMIHFQNAVGNSVKNSHILNTGYNAIQINKYAQNNVIYGNRIEDIGYHGIHLTGYGLGAGPFTNAKDSYVNKLNVISNNIIQSTGRNIGHGMGMQICYSGNNDLAHNLFSDLPRTAIFLQGMARDHLWKFKPYGNAIDESKRWDHLHHRNNWIAYNDVSNYACDTQDLGGIYGWGTGKGNVIENNIVHHPGPTFGFLSAIYLDDYFDYGIVKNNIIHSIYRHRKVEPAIITNVEGNDYYRDREIYPLLVKGTGNVATNNFVVQFDGGDPVFSWGMGSPKSSLNLSFTKNIFYVPKGQSAILFNDWHEQRLNDVDYNLYWPADGKTVSFNIVPNITTFSKWREMLDSKLDVNSKITDDPMFADPDNYDFTLLPDSPAHELGIKNIDQKSIGLRDDFIHNRDINVYRLPVSAYQSSIDKTAWSATAVSSQSVKPASMAIDGDAETEWHLDSVQEVGSWFLLDMGEVQKINRLNVELGGRSWSSPECYHILLSDDGKTFSEPIANGAQDGYLMIDQEFESQEVRYIKIVIEKASPIYSWAIREINVYN